MEAVNAKKKLERAGWRRRRHHPTPGFAPFPFLNWDGPSNIWPPFSFGCHVRSSSLEAFTSDMGLAMDTSVPCISSRLSHCLQRQYWMASRNLKDGNCGSIASPDWQSARSESRRELCSVCEAGIVQYIASGQDHHGHRSQVRRSLCLSAPAQASTSV
ncbi:hypothetical protein BR93DRAFT_472128 [Coniochaeta sp. PMI_546]|nr:hypothetical protein BR93DRAFT_472128 [Coniochaeta sp. PMI_546]